MADLLTDAMDTLAGEMESFAARSVTYMRGAISGTVSATIGRTAFRFGTSAGESRLTFSDRDYLIRLSSWEAASPTLIKPQRGDRITDGAEVYEVYSPTDEPAVHREPWGQAYRLHTRRVS